MRYGLPLLFYISLAAACLHPLSAHAQGILGLFSASADSASAGLAPSDKYSPSRRFFVEFRARNAASYGHMYVMYGEVNERREVIRSEIAGFFPAGDSRNCENCSVYYWTIGHVIPVPSEIGASDGDLEEQYVLARYRVWIDEVQYKRLVAYIKQRKAYKAPWHAVLNNCVAFGRDVAAFLNLNVPALMRISPFVVMFPEAVVEGIRDANGGEKDQGPLKDSPGTLSVEVASQVHAKTTQAAAPKQRLAKKPEENKLSSTIH